MVSHLVENANVPLASINVVDIKEYLIGILQLPYSLYWNSDFLGILSLYLGGAGVCSHGSIIP